MPEGPTMFDKINDRVNRNSGLRKVKRALLDPCYRGGFRLMKHTKSKNTYRLTGMRRSGNHAFLYWLMGQLRGPVYFLNNLGPFQNPYTNEINKLYFNGIIKPSLVVSHEDQPTDKTFGGREENRFGRSGQFFEILILRDPQNFVASRLAWQDEQGKRFREDTAYRGRILEIWKEHAQRYLEIEQLRADGNETQLLAVNYNRWFSDKSYRRKLAANLSLQFSDRGKEIVREYGHGSSFEGRKYHGAASDARVLQRYQNYEEDPLYQEIFEDRQLLEYRNKIFA